MRRGVRTANPQTPTQLHRQSTHAAAHAAAHTAAHATTDPTADPMANPTACQLRPTHGSGIILKTARLFLAESAALIRLFLLYSQQRAKPSSYGPLVLIRGSCRLLGGSFQFPIILFRDPE